MSEENKELETSQETAQAAEAEKTTKRKNEKKESVNIGKEIWEWIYTIAIAVIIAFLIKNFLFDIVRVDGSSMYPTLVDNDRLIVTKLGYEPKHGDIIILDSTYKKREAYYDKLAAQEGKDELSTFDKLLNNRKLPSECKKVYYVKRVIALPGQTVDLGDDGRVYVDGVAVDEPYANGETRSIDSTVQYPVTVEDGMVFVMGDNRMHSKDSRSSDLGQVPQDAILGKSQVRVWPFNSISLTR